MVCATILIIYSSTYSVCCTVDTQRNTSRTSIYQYNTTSILELLITFRLGPRVVNAQRYFNRPRLQNYCASFFFDSPTDFVVARRKIDDLARTDPPPPSGLSKCEMQGVTARLTQVPALTQCTSLYESLVHILHTQSTQMCSCQETVLWQCLKHKG